MRHWSIAILCISVAAVIGCAEESQTLFPAALVSPPGQSETNRSDSSSLTSNVENFQTITGRADAGVEYSTTAILEKTSIQVQELKFGATRFHASGYAPSAGICLTVVWDYQSDELAVARHCGDLLAEPNFSHVSIRTDQNGPCGFISEQVVDVTSAKGCFDPIQGQVNATLEITLDGVRYVIRADNQTSL